MSVGQLDRLIRLLAERDYLVLGPRLRDGVIGYGELSGIEDLPAGWSDEHEPGTYRIRRRDDQALFGYTMGPDSWKPFFHPPRAKLWSADKTSGQVSLNEQAGVQPRLALIGVRSCELHAIRIQDRVLLEHDYPDPVYQQNRTDAFVVAVNCGQAGQTCFCDSMGTGPQVTHDYDLALTELPGSSTSRFLIEAGSVQGEGLLTLLDTETPSANDLDAARRALDNARQGMGRVLDTSDIKSLLQDNPEHPHWDEIAARCLACANCTMVCPTCFCTTTHDQTDLTGQHAERWRSWDSCFNVSFSYLHGGSVRESTSARYRQWLTHKLAN